MRYDVSVIGLYILDVLGRPVTRIPERGNVDFIEEIRLTVAGTAGGTVVDTAKLGLKSLAVGAVGDDEKADWVLLTLGKHGLHQVQPFVVAHLRPARDLGATAMAAMAQAVVAQRARANARTENGSEVGRHSTTLG